MYVYNIVHTFVSFSNLFDDFFFCFIIVLRVYSLVEFLKGFAFVVSAVDVVVFFIFLIEIISGSSQMYTKSFLAKKIKKKIKNL